MVITAVSKTAFLGSSPSVPANKIYFLNSQYPSDILLSMLTKTDFIQIRKILKEVVRDEVGNEVQALKDELGSDINMSRMRIQSDISELKDRIKNLEIRISKMHAELKKEIKAVFYFLDKDIVGTIKRVGRIEEHLGLSAQ